MVVALAEMRDALCREYQLSGHADERTAIEDAIVALAVAEERIARALAPTSA